MGCASVRTPGPSAPCPPPPAGCCGSCSRLCAPLQGIQYLTEHKLLSPDVQDIAQFLYKGEGLNKTAIGTYLGERYGRGASERQGRRRAGVCVRVCVCAGT